TIQPNDTIFLQDRVERNLILDAIKNFAAAKTKPSLNESTITAAVDKTQLTPAEELIVSGKQFLMEGKLNEAEEKFAAVLQLDCSHQAALYELNSLAVMYLNEGIEKYFSGASFKSENLFKSAVQILSLEEVAEKYSKNLVTAYQFLAIALIEKYYLGNDKEENAFEEARHYIARILAINPGFELEKKYFSPKIIDIFRTS
ncbi:MAG TPA: hypothetical protein VK469_18205, partial [Candidatus Kapabacteria bacterium]|nr:hypothetical protein [Candidatus Kapabacteria bacterium]